MDRFSAARKNCDEQGASATLEAEADLRVCTGLNVNFRLVIFFIIIDLRYD